ncbi:bifunctional 2-polyprenyl-6-hydroxyphenol methylase/3-demethylubiquinol 3-O-methyltransferase UbiG [Variovorax sp. OV329]|uniref:class I SAM-dependent methyltransferase n=1 Tax=Variovorax sp. OV329 TaxID=1882825 RepID=UPI0008E81C6C|nr:class I SAM-dependent methyltransferase [Variovorax sp. OV329]SFM10962.1 Methyltransferase domain-containing protein [Variovorax sp. OV329]
MDFYDELAPLYHLIFPDWRASIARQGGQLHSIVQVQWPGARRLLDLSCGIGTQAIGLAARGLSVRAPDLSPVAVERARQEANAQGVSLALSVGDMRHAHALHGSGFDVVLSCDNSVPHLLMDEDILLALREMHRCLRSGGGVLLSVRDYAKEERGRNLVKHYGVREEGGRRYVLFQVWDFEGDHYDFSFFVVEEDPRAKTAVTRVMRSRYYAIGTDRLLELMAEAGFGNVRRIDDAYYQPVLVGTK